MCNQPWLVWLVWVECCPVNQKVAGSIPSKDTCLGCGSAPWLIHVSLSSSLPLSLEINKILKKDRMCNKVLHKIFPVVKVLYNLESKMHCNVLILVSRREETLITSTRGNVAAADDCCVLGYFGRIRMTMIFQTFYKCSFLERKHPLCSICISCSPPLPGAFSVFGAC